jgi:hypothetical protein
LNHFIREKKTKKKTKKKRKERKKEKLEFFIQSHAIFRFVSTFLTLRREW